MDAVVAVDALLPPAITSEASSGRKRRQWCTLPDVDDNDNDDVDKVESSMLSLDDDDNDVVAADPNSDLGRERRLTAL